MGAVFGFSTLKIGGGGTRLLFGTQKKPRTSPPPPYSKLFPPLIRLSFSLPILLCPTRAQLYVRQNRTFANVSRGTARAYPEGAPNLTILESSPPEPQAFPAPPRRFSAFLADVALLGPCAYPNKSALICILPLRPRSNPSNTGTLHVSVRRYWYMYLLWCLLAEIQLEVHMHKAAITQAVKAKPRTCWEPSPDHWHQRPVDCFWTWGGG